MKKLGFSLFGLAAVVSAHAALNLNINVPYQTVVRPSSGTIQVVFTGTVDVLLPNFDVDVAILEFPGSSSSVFLNAAFDPAFITYLGGNSPGVDYSGNLFSVDVSSTTPQDFYWLNSGNNNPLSELIVFASDNSGHSSWDNEMYGVTVVPEPATMAALSIGAVALLRRRRK